ncbi:MAG TPA: DUF839 domain-containing protein [Synechococcales cyanobacterium M55_K2018_004]|nr:DUF839 domain-containing protein [Synechococcales cyanobacterium M55_K2018_004]
MTLKRRQFLTFLGATAGSLALSPLVKDGRFAMPFMGEAADASTVRGLSFTPVKSPIPLENSGLSAEQQKTAFSTFQVVDDMVLPPGFTYDVIAAWGDRVGDSRFGYNNDYLSFIETAPNEGFLTVNFEYISGKTWLQTYPLVIRKPLPIAEVRAAAEAAGENGIDVMALPDSDPRKAQIQQLCKEALTDLGIGVISIRRNPNGQWVRTNSRSDRRITGISGLEDGRYLKSTGPATAVFRKASGQGYLDRLGDKIIGTFNNCAGGTSPWGTVFSAEENYQDYVPEGVYADGTSLPLSKRPFSLDVDGINGLGTALGYAGNKYGWMVEVDPANPNDYGTKHTWLGRFRHEAVAIRAVPNRKLAVYSGCDRRGGHLYKFISRDNVVNPTAKTNSRLLENGMLYAAKFNADGTGRWIALAPSTPVDPELPSQHVGGMIPLPKRPDGGFERVREDAAVAAFKQQFRTLGDLYTGNPVEKQGAILIDAHFAANAAGATCTARPEDTDVAADGTLFIAFTSGSPSSSDGSPNKAIFKGPQGGAWEFGWIMKLREDGNDPAALTFRWEMMAMGGEPVQGGAGFANPDNLEIDRFGNLWMVTDMSTEKHNLEIASRTKADGSAVSQSDLRGIYGNNSIWFLPTSGPNAGEAFLFGYGPMECEMCGPFFTRDQQTLFLAAQHPGEINGIRKDMEKVSRRFALKTTDGQDFMQTREVPIGSNWPTKRPNDPPKPAVIAVRKVGGGSLTRG